MINKEGQPQDSSPITTQEIGLTFENFANQPEYQDVNRAQVNRLIQLFPNPFFHLDVATGTGLVPTLLTDASKRRGLSGQIIGIDPNNTSLDIARRTTPRQDGVSVLYIAGFGQEIEKLVKGKIPEGGVDSISIHDALHEIEGEENKNAVLIAMRNVLRPGGLFSFNSAFTTYGVEADNAQMKWGRWKLGAFNNLGGKKDRTAEPIKIHSPEQYRQMIESVGFVLIEEPKRVVVNLTRAALEGISRYPKFIEGVFGDMIDQGKFTLERKSKALIDALKDVEFLPRGWYEIIAQKPPVTIS